jgi:hypothetical protein
MATYQSFAVARTTEPDAPSLLASLKALDATAGVQHVPGLSSYIIKKATVWTPAQVTAVQNVLETAPVTSPELTAQAGVDMFSIATQALVLALIDQLNVLRAALPVPLPPITPAQALAAIRAKAGTL